MKKILVIIPILLFTFLVNAQDEGKLIVITQNEQTQLPEYVDKVILIKGNLMYAETPNIIGVEVVAPEDKTTYDGEKARAFGTLRLNENPGNGFPYWLEDLKTKEMTKAVFKDNE